MKERHDSRRIFLLTPYTGGNLGDQAIIESLIGNLQSRYRNVKLVGLTQRPQATATLHGIPCFPISAPVASEAPGTWLHRPKGRSSRTNVPITGSDVDKLESRVRHRQRRNVFGTAIAIRGLEFVRKPLRLFQRGRLEISFSFRAAHLLNRGDLLLLAGGGQIDDEWGGAWAHPFTLWRWATLARLRGCSVAAASVGWGQLRRGLSRWFVRNALKHAKYCSYRDMQSASWAAELGLEGDAPPRFIPDLALGLAVNPRDCGTSTRRSDLIGLSPMAFGRVGTWPTTDHEVYRRYIRELAQFAAACARSEKHVVVFTSSRMDRVAVQDFFGELQKILKQETACVTSCETRTLDQLLNVLATCESVVASRLHGVILSHLVNVPTLAISFDRKVDAHMRDVKQSNYCINIREFDSAQLAERHAELTRASSEIRGKLKEFVSSCQAPLTQQFETLGQLAGYIPSNSIRKASGVIQDAEASEMRDSIH